jgi:hypothetical protein
LLLRAFLVLLGFTNARGFVLMWIYLFCLMWYSGENKRKLLFSYFHGSICICMNLDFLGIEVSCCVRVKIKHALIILLPLSLYVGSVQHVFHHVVIKIRKLFLRPAACLTTLSTDFGKKKICPKKKNLLISCNYISMEGLQEHLLLRQLELSKRIFTIQTERT